MSYLVLLTESLESPKDVFNIGSSDEENKIDHQIFCFEIIAKNIH